MSYKELERDGLLLPVVEARVRYLAPARYEDPVRVRCWVRDTASRMVTFGYAIDHVETGQLLATAQTRLIAVDSKRVRVTGGRFRGMS